MSGRTARAMRERFLAAMARRAGDHDEAVRRRLDERLSAARAADAAHAGQQVGADQATPPCSALAGLLAQIGSRTVPQSPAFPELAALGEFRQRWAAIRAESRLRQALQPLPVHAGPLNSAGLAHRSIALMRELSPGYLQQFLAYVDELAWMEQMVGSDTHGSATSSGKRARRKPRG
ncbi:MAG: DUF2894 domain-containing protein [Xanthomonadaceae bacterium]|nr:DUF2894 domain-containing protein [Xanthomonadaceae bacterium]